MEMKCDKHGWVQARHFCHKCVADYLTRIAKLEGELGLVLEYFNRGTPYWYGDSPADRIRSVLTEPETKEDKR
jgi:hypothetical protein